MEKKVNVRPMKVYLICDECGTEMKRPDDFVIATYPPQYNYRCPKCGRTETTTQGYPYIDFVEEGGVDIIEHIEELDNTLHDVSIMSVWDLDIKTELNKLIKEIYNKYPSGGALHIVLDDDNIEDEHIMWCIENAINNNFETYYNKKDMGELEEDRQMFLRCARLLLSIPEDERQDIIDKSMD